MKIGIEHIEVYLPPNGINNEILASRFKDFTADEVYKKSGVKCRYHSTKDVIPSDMAFYAAEELFAKNKVAKSDIDLLIFCTEGADYIAPATACILQDRIGLSKNVMAFDVPLGCSGFAYSLGIAKSLIESGMASKALLLFGDVPSFGCHPEDFALVSIFSDAGAAILISKDASNQIGEFTFGTDGAGYKNLFVDRSGMRNPVDQKWLAHNEDVGGLPIGQMKMDGIEIFKFSLREVPKLIAKTLEKNELNFEDIDLFVFHQASAIILKVLQRKLKIPKEKMVNYIEDYGNTVSVSIPLALKQADAEGRILKGNKILIAGFGIGYSWGASVIYY